MASGGQNDYLLGGNNDGKRSWSTIQCIGFAFVIAALVGFFSNLDRIIDGDSDSGSSPSPPSLPDSVVDVVTGDSDLSELATLVTNAGLIDTLNNAEAVTVFGPTNEAFAAVTVPNDTTVVSELLKYHVIDQQSIPSSALSSGLVATTLQGETITCYIEGDNVYFYDSIGERAQVISADNEAKNGYVHVVNKTLISGGVVTNATANIDELSLLYGALVANGLDAVLSDPTSEFTVFAPDNDAVGAFTGNISASLLTYHVIPSKILSTELAEDTRTEVQTVNGASLYVTRANDEVVVEDSLGREAVVTIANIASTNGVVHIIDEVLADTEFRNIVELAVGNNDLTTLVSALTATGLDEALEGPGPFTVLAPTNEAFALINSTVAGLNVTQLTDVLLYHVISGSIASTDISPGAVAQTLLSPGDNYDLGTVTAFLIDDTVGFYDNFGGNSTVITANIEATNGVIHIIDRVLLPGGTVADVTGTITELSTLNDALKSFGLNDTLAGDVNVTLFAPSNEAVSAFNGNIDAGLLLYHVVGDRFLAGFNLPEGNTSVPTLNGTDITVINNGSGVFVRDVTGNEGQVTTANVNAVNGVVHIVDIVLDNQATTTTSTTTTTA